MDTFSAPHFRDDAAARDFLEGLLWPHGPVCPHCGSVGHAYRDKAAGRIPLRREGVSEGLHRHDGDGNGAQPHRVAQVVTGVPSDDVIKEGRLGAPAAPHARHGLSVRLVHGAPHP